MTRASLEEVDVERAERDESFQRGLEKVGSVESVGSVG